MSTSLRQHLSDVIEKVFSDWLDVRKLWQDRTSILFNPIESLDGTRPLQNRPWPFAAKALLLPGGIVSACVAGVTFFLPMPPTGLEQAIANQQQVQRILVDGQKKLERPLPSKDRPFSRLSDAQLEARRAALFNELNRARSVQPRTPNVKAQMDRVRDEIVAVIDENFQRIMAGLSTSFLKAQQESLRNEAFLKAILRLKELAEKWRFLILGITLLLNAFTFRWLVRRRGSDFEAPEDADTAHLYLTGAALLLPNFAVGVTNVLVDIGDRYQLDWLPLAYQLLSVGLGIWLLLRLRSIVPVLTVQLRPSPKLSMHKAKRMIANRLVLSNFASFLAVNALLAIIGVPILFWLIQHPK
jgi:hypothetical protein